LVEKIIDSHGNFSGKFTRAMDFGGFTSEQIVINFIVCDGDPERTQRDPLLGKGLTKVGVAFGKHNIYSTVCVFVSCTEFESNNSDDTPIFKDVKFSIDDENESEEEKKRKEKEEKEREKKKEKEYEKKKEKEEKEREKAIEEGKRREEEKKKEEQKRREEAKKKEGGVRKKLSITNQNGDLFKLPKKKFFAFNSVEKDQLPEGVVSMTTRDTIIIEGGKRYKKIIINKVLVDGTTTTEEVKECLD
jgi:flagellar biosynthesis GTPase FlhF